MVKVSGITKDNNFIPIENEMTDEQKDLLNNKGWSKYTRDEHGEIKISASKKAKEDEPEEVKDKKNGKK